MKTYALIDTYSGYVWGIVQAEDPISACRLVDEDAKVFGREYEEVYYSNNGSAYDVYVVPDGFSVDDGSTQAAIDAVEQYDRVVRVACHGEGY